MPNRTFYFTDQNLNNLMSEEIPNKTLNMILSNYYVGRIALNTTRIGASEEKKQKFEELKTKYPPLNIMAEEPSVGLVEDKILGMREQTIAPPEYGA